MRQTLRPGRFGVVDDTPAILFNTAWDDTSDGDFTFLWTTHSAKTSVEIRVDGIDRTSDFSEAAGMYTLPSSLGYLNGGNEIKVISPDLIDSDVIELDRRHLRTPMDLSGINGATNMTRLKLVQRAQSHIKPTSLQTGDIIWPASASISSFQAHTAFKSTANIDLSWMTGISVSFEIEGCESEQIVGPAGGFNVGNGVPYISRFPNCTDLDYSNLIVTGSAFGSFRIQDCPNLTAVLLSPTEFNVNVYLFSNGNFGYDPSVIDAVRWNAFRNLNIQNNLFPVGVVNRYLYELDLRTASEGVSSGTISIGGTNAAPDSSSAGYDGVAAVASLQARGITVNHS